MGYKKLKREFLLLFLFLCVGVTWVNAEDGYFIKATYIEGPEKTNAIVIRNSRDDFGIDPEMEIFFTNYFTVWFDALSELKEGDVRTFFDTSDQIGVIGSMIDQTALSFIIEVRKRQDNDLRLNDYTCGITYKALETLENGDLKVTLTEDNSCHFAFIPKVDSTSTGIMHMFIIRKTEAGYAIIRHDKDEAGYLLFSSIWDENTREENEALSLKGDLGAIKENYLNQAEIDLMQLKIKKETLQPTVKKEIAGAQPYWSEQAVIYAMQWTDPVCVLRNEHWESYDGYDGNCNNFISQCLDAGGIPMDFTGNWQWKYFGDEVDDNEWSEGRSGSWTGVEEFYNYADNNTGIGLLADTKANPYSGEPGDILQYGIADNWKHSVIIVDVIKDENRKVRDYLINSNTTDRRNYPASAYAYSNQRLIKILGYGI